MKLRDKLLIVMTVVSVLALVWLLASLSLSLFANGWLYDVEQPVPVTVEDGRVNLSITRYSRLDLVGTCSAELNCEFVHEYGDWSCLIDKGQRELQISYPLPTFDANGPCEIHGAVMYQPLGWLGPTLSHHWHTEQFRIE